MIHIHILKKVYLFNINFILSDLRLWKYVSFYLFLANCENIDRLDSISNIRNIRELSEEQNACQNVASSCPMFSLSLNCLFSHQLIVPLKQCFVQQQLSQEFFIESSILEILSYFWLASMEFNISEIKTSKTVKFEWLAS